MNVTITTTAQNVTVHSPYNSEFVDAAKRLGGKWRDNAWVFDAREESRVREICRENYGSDGLTANLCTIRVKLGPRDNQLCGPIEIFGRPIARAFGRDSGAKLCTGVVLLEGSFSSGGSHKNWYTTADTGTVVLVRDVPRSRVQEKLDAGDTRISVEAEQPIVDREALMAEREKLAARIADIDAILG